MFVYAKKGGEWVGDFCKVLDESSIEADIPEKAPQILYGTWYRYVLDDLYLGLIHLQSFARNNMPERYSLSYHEVGFLPT